MVLITSEKEDASENQEPRTDETTRLRKSPCKTSGHDLALDKEEHEKLECPICFEPFNTFKNAPHVLHCGHTLCRKCVSRLSRAFLKLEKLQPIPLPFLVSCPWCNRFSLRLVIKGKLKYPSKNYFVLWMVHSTKTNLQMNLCTQDSSSDHEDPPGTAFGLQEFGFDFPVIDRKSLVVFLCKSCTCFADVTPIIPSAFILIFVGLWTIPVSAFVLFLYVFVSLLAWSALVFLMEFCFPQLGMPI